jgi:excisionase family DNA binding protein
MTAAGRSQRIPEEANETMGSRSDNINGLAGKQVFTTGEAAQVCGVSQQTIIRCFDSGKLHGFRVPGSRFRRIPRGDLLRFMKSNGIPCDSLGGSKPRILIVDDDQAIIDLIVEILGSDGRYDLITANTGYEAGILTERHRPDLILLDYMLPDINGNEVCKRVKGNPQTANTRIVIVSGAVDRNEIANLVEDGADDFIAKPFDPMTLSSRILELTGS